MKTTATKKMEAVKKLQEATDHMKAAIEALQAIKDDPQMRSFIGEDAGYYRTQLEELISCDDGEAGIESLIQILNQRYL